MCVIIFNDYNIRNCVLQVHIQNSTLAGGVAVGSCCHMVLFPWATVLLGCCAAVISVCGFEYITVST